MLYNIQILRAVAAILVVHAHASGGAGLRLEWRGGAAGVDLFFVISGFIIAYVASLDTDQFLTRRLVRVVPIYWSSTLALYVLLLLVPHVFRSASTDPELLGRSLLFLPTSSAVHTADGIPHPTLSGGWTLNYEMYFYVVFAIALSVSRRWATLVATGLLFTVMSVITWTGLASSPVAFFYAHPIVLEFVFGMIAFHLVTYIHAQRWRAALPGLQKVLLGAGGIGGLLVLAFSADLFERAPRWIVSGIPSFVVVVCAVLLERVHDWKLTNPVAILVGDASYVLYLIHAYLVFGIIRVVIGNHEFGEAMGQLIVLGLIIVSVAASMLVYRYYEQPILRALKRRFIHPKPRRARGLPQS